MPSSAGPNTAGESNLVFAYDTGDIINSYKGEPTVNYVVSPTTVGYSGYEFMQYTDLAPIFNTYGSSSLYSLSLDLKSQNTANQNQILVYMQNGSTTKYGFVGQWVTATTEYQRFKFEGLTPSISNPADTVAMLAFYGIYGTGNNPYVKNVQVEIKPHCTPFVNGTRSVSGSLLSLVQNATANVANMSFDSNAQMYFDGTNDSVNLGLLNITSTPFTYETVIKTDSITGGYAWIIGKAGYNMGLNRYDNYIRFFLYDSSNNLYSAEGGTLNTSSYFHVVGVFTGANLLLYINGVLISASGGIVTPKNYDGQTTYVGTPNASNLYYQGQIPIVKIYNQALSTTEIKQNYQAYKSRFNLA